MAFDLGFILGAPRSGTTWLQQLVGAHPQVVTPQETDYFSYYLPEWMQLFEEQLAASDQSSLRRRGLPAVLTQKELRTVLQETTQRVFTTLFEIKPTATMLVEKTPSNSRYATFLAENFPDARFVHMLRDGRDASASLMRASKGWGGAWAARSVEGATQRWKVHVEMARSIRHLSDRYMEIKYEDLLEDEQLLKAVFDFLGVKCTDSQSKEIYERFTLKQHGAASSIVWSGEARARFGSDFEEPSGFFGKGGSGGWKSSFGVYDKVAFDLMAGDLLSDLGYAQPGWTGVPRAARLAFIPLLLTRNAARRVLYWWRLIKKDAESSTNTNLSLLGASRNR